MKGVALAIFLVVCIAVMPGSEAQDTYSTASSCKINVMGCPSGKADNHCNKCCRKAGCNRGDCHAHNCKCKGCSG